MSKHKPLLATHTPVAVRCSYDGSWVDGFEVLSVVRSESAGTTYALRRKLDGMELPTEFSEDDVRPS